ncbi:hypothetical protein [Leeia aquatica]|uniref:Uncharacterized protein n=1 Tax=Leeia aquatica TaxID=2725557 RepID=A0A847RWF0_9NEIS|nr:hypothetical protein [Leeia aquatica]NLR74131.1 hypothetical protein [Leeia aquatica]
MLLGLITLVAVHIAQADEALSFGPAIRAELPRETLKVLPLLPLEPPKALAVGAEVLVISGYKPGEVDRQKHPVQVRVDRPGSRVLLILVGGKQTRWQLTATPQTTVVGILVSGFEPQTLSTSVPTLAYRVALGEPREIDSPEFGKLMSQLNALFGITKVDVFQGHGTLPPDICITQLDPPSAALTQAGPQPQKPDSNFVFSLITKDFIRVNWSLTGPQESVKKAYYDRSLLVLSDSGRALYRMDYSGDFLEIIDLPEERSTLVHLPPDFPEFSHPRDIAYDSKREIVSIVTWGGHGYWYRYDAKNRKWLDYQSLQGVDLASLTYDRKLDRYVALEERGDGLFLIAAESGDVVKRKVQSRLEGRGRITRESGLSLFSINDKLWIAPNGDDIALVYVNAGKVKRIWHYNVKTDKVVMTY